ncbi:MAG: endolytic transglycosylase MltG [Chloroflexi bacterium]|nr:endolytic transglycosylase MltG [Chloroflexota bacterium]
MPSNHPPRTVPRWQWIAGGLLLLGGLAWLVALTVIALSPGEKQPDPPPPTGERVVLLPTLAAATGTPIPTPPDTPTATPTITPPPSATPAPTQPGDTPAPDSSAAASATPAGTTATAAGSGAPCTPPEGWERYVVQPEDTLFAFVLGANNTVTVDELVAANCLGRRWLQVGDVLFLPPGAAENAPPSAPAAPASGGASGPRTPNCPCTINVVPGWRREQIADAIDAAETLFTGADFLALTGPDAPAPHDFAAERPPGTTLEGFLFPGSYTVQNDTTAEGFRNLLLDAFGANVSAQMRADAAAQGTSFYQALIIASIVQRETRDPEKQKLVASVYLNRYRDGNRLASTVPVQYALGRPGNWWPRITYATAEVDSPYNTYTRAGLPPGPISNPDLSAIAGTVYSPATNYYYHTASCDGRGEVFAETYEEHLANVNCE